MPADPDLARDVDARCRLTGEFTLRSGQVSHEYFDKYLFETDPALLTRVAAQMEGLLPDDVDLLGGLEMGGIPIVTALSARTGLPALFVRKKAKDYGTCKLAEGPEVGGGRVTLVEDVIATGGAVRDATTRCVRPARSLDLVVCAIDRSPAGDNPLADVALEVLAVLTKADLDAVRPQAEVAVRQRPGRSSRCSRRRRCCAATTRRRGEDKRASRPRMT